MLEVGGVSFMVFVIPALLLLPGDSLAGRTVTKWQPPACLIARLLPFHFPTLD